MLYLTNDRLIQKEKWNAYLSKLGQILVSGFDCHFLNWRECRVVKSQGRGWYFLLVSYTQVHPPKGRRCNFLFYLEIGR